MLAAWGGKTRNLKRKDANNHHHRLLQATFPIHSTDKCRKIMGSDTKILHKDYSFCAGKLDYTNRKDELSVSVGELHNS